MEDGEGAGLGEAEEELGEAHSPVRLRNDRSRLE